MQMNRRFFLEIFLFLSVAMGYGSFGLAQNMPAPSTKKQKTVKLRFDDELVKGSAVAPDIDTLSVKRNFNYKKLIRVRENFTKEMEDGLNDQ